ncbi:MAG: MBL fold metallo-hydrolase [Acidobacteria bacterium]|nr:MAG: MBL fold metallo-hydrolase [Acidobacteriota bacterium]
MTRTTNRRQFFVGAASLAFSSYLFARIARGQDKNRTRIILLGTKGGPTLSTRTGRSGPSTLILINDVPYVIDCGYGVSRQLTKAGVALDRIRYIFITHHHSDHNLEYGPLLYNAWVTAQPIHIDAYGPTGLKKLTQDFFEYEKFDIDTRLVDEGGTDPRQSIFVHEFEKAGDVLRNGDVHVTSCRVRHPPITQSYAYRFDARDRSIVVSGDTAYAPELAEFSKGADVLIHEAMYLPAVDKLIKQNPGATRLREHLLAAHTSCEDVGRIAAQAEVKTLVLAHLVPGDDPSITDEQWSEGVRKHFKGRIIVGRDLMEI